jgi:hypothetical protein
MEQKLTEQELQELKTLQENYSKVTVQLGQLKVEQILLNTQVKRLQDVEAAMTNDYIKLQEQEATFVKSLETKYGVGEINIETGVFTKLN